MHFAGPRTRACRRGIIASALCARSVTQLPSLTVRQRGGRGIEPIGSRPAPTRPHRLPQRRRPQVPSTLVSRLGSSKAAFASAVRAPSARCGSSLKWWNRACHRRRARGGSRSEGSQAAAPSQGRHSSPQARISFGQEMAGAPRPCLQPWTQIHQTQKIIPTDPTLPPCSSRAFSHARGLRNCTGPVRTTSGRAPRIVEHAQAA